MHQMCPGPDTSRDQDASREPSAPSRSPRPSADPGRLPFFFDALFV